MNNEVVLSSDENNDYLSVTDKIIGVISEPVTFYKRFSNLKPKASNWLVPLLLLIVIASVTNYLMMNNPIIKNQAVDKQMSIIEKALEDAVASGQIPQATADAQLEQYRVRIEEQIESGTLISVASLLVITFVMFFIVSAVLFLIARLLLKGEGDYSKTMSAYGTAYYILVLQVIFMLIYALASDRLVTGLNLAFLLDMDTKQFGGFLLSKVDPFTIWFYALVSIGLAKMFKSESTGKYLGAVFSLWLGFSIIFYLAAQQLPFLQMFI